MKIGGGVSELWRVENLPLPLTWPQGLYNSLYYHRTSRDIYQLSNIEVLKLPIFQQHQRFKVLSVVKVLNRKHRQRANNHTKTFTVEAVREERNRRSTQSDYLLYSWLWAGCLL